MDSNKESNNSDETKEAEPLQTAVPAGPLKTRVANLRTEAVGSATGNPRNKVALRPGFSLMDWIRLTNSGRDLTGTGGKILEVSLAELAKHRTRQDTWMAINGIVFNVTDYNDFHPGGVEELMRGAGKDATKLFNEVHRWVNYESMLQACVVGKLIQGPKLPLLSSRSLGLPSAKIEPLRREPRESNSSLTIKPPQKIIPPIQSRKPTFNWHQTESTVTVSIYTRRPEITREDIIVQVEDQVRLQVLVQIHDEGKEEYRFQIAFKLNSKIIDTEKPKVNIGTTSGKIEIVFKKSDSSEKQWTTLGTPLPGNDTFSALSEYKSEIFKEFRPWTLLSAEAVTRDVIHFVFQPPQVSAFHFLVPCGHHVHIQAEIEGMALVRSYTPTLATLNLDAYSTTVVDDDKNLHFLIKIYNDGAMTQHLKDLRIGSQVSISNHAGNFRPSKLKEVSQLILLAAGTGFTPMAKVMQYFSCVASGSAEKRETLLIFFNKTEQDIIWKTELEKFQRDANQKENFSVTVHHVLSDAASGWVGRVGRISGDLLRDLMPTHAVEKKRLACVCGPTGFTTSAQSLLMESFSFATEDIFLFQG